MTVPKDSEGGVVNN